MKFKKYLKRKALHKLFEKKLKNSEIIGTDGVSTRQFLSIINDEINIIKRKIKNHTYKFSPYKEQLILKGKDSNPRMISIPTNRDRLTLSSLQKFLSDKFKDSLSNDNVNTKVAEIIKTIELQQYESFIKVDIENFFPNIDHVILLEKIEKHIDDVEAIYVINKAIKQVTISKGRRKNKQNETNNKGVPQGLSISNILSKIYLSDLDKKFSTKSNLKYFRYVDDILIFCNKDDVEKIIFEIREQMRMLQLTMHEIKDNSEKSTVGSLKEDKFQYLGFEFFKDKISVRESSIDRLRERIVGVFCKNVKKDDSTLYKELNLKISGCVYNNKQYGWIYFFRQINDLTLLYSLDEFVKKLFKKFHREYDEKKIKKFTKTYYFLKSYNIKKLHSKSYIPNFTKEEKLKKIIQINMKKIVLNFPESMKNISLDSPQKIEIKNSSLSLTKSMKKAIVDLKNDVEYY